MAQLSHLYMTPGKTIALTICTFVSEMMSLLFNMLSRFVIAFLPRSTHLLIWFYLWANQPCPKVKRHHCSTWNCGSKDHHKDRQDQAPGPSSREKSGIPSSPRMTGSVMEALAESTRFSCFRGYMPRPLGTLNLRTPLRFHTPPQNSEKNNTTETAGSIGRHDKERAWLLRSPAPAWQLVAEPWSSVTWSDDSRSSPGISPAPGSWALLPTRPSSFPH